MKKKKKRLNFKKVFIFLIVIIITIFSIYSFFTYNIKNIYVIDNIYYSDQEIIDMAKLDKYPTFFTTFSMSIRKRVVSNPYIESVRVKKKWLGKVYIYIEEEKSLFYKNKDTLVLGNGEEIVNSDLVVSVPLLFNSVPEKYYEKLISEMNKIDDCVISKISQMEFKPNDMDDGRFLLYMKDGNYVYVTLLTFDILNNYNEIILELEGKNGILYLDSGNYFEILD